MADEFKDGYYGILKQKPSFEGLSRYRQPFNYELAGKEFHLIMDLDTDYVVRFISGHILEWGAYKQIPQRCYYECAKADETTYFVNFELSGVKPRTGLTVILDLEQRLVTLNKCYTDFSEKYPTLVDSDFDFGAIAIDGFPLPRIRHGYTADLVGKRIRWTYGPEFTIIHVYYSPYYVRGTFPPEALARLPPMTPEEAAAWAENPYDEKATYIKIKRNIYALSIIEQHMSKRGAPGNSLFFLMDLERVHDVGRSFGHRGNVGAGNKFEGENYMFAAYGDFVASDGTIEAQKNVYLPDQEHSSLRELWNQSGSSIYSDTNTRSVQMDNILDFIKETGVGYFATVENKQPRVRPFGFGFYEAGKFWFCTNNTKKVYAQLQATPYAEIIFSKADFSRYLRLSGHVVFDTSLDAKKKVFEAMPGVAALYKTPDNPIFEVFYIEKGEAVLETFPPSGPAHIVRF